MYAIVETGGKQYQVEEGRYLDVELLGGEKDSKIVFDKVVMIVNGKKSKVYFFSSYDPIEKRKEFLAWETTRPVDPDLLRDGSRMQLSTCFRGRRMRRSAK